jgi:hypothetical protein
MRSARWAFAAIGATVCAVAMTLTLGGCSVAKPTAGSPDPGLRGQWVLASGDDTFGPMNLLGQDITLSITAAAAATGRSSCSDYSVTIYGPQRSLWVTTSAPHSYACATADQNVIQLEYLQDLGRVQHATVTSSGLDLAGQGVELRFTRATLLPIPNLVGRLWQLRTAGTISLHSAYQLHRESEGSMHFVSPTTLRATTTCSDFTVHFMQVADELVAQTMSIVTNRTCSRSGDSAAADFTTVFGHGFSFALGAHALTLTSTRAGKILVFDEGVSP